MTDLGFQPPSTDSYSAPGAANSPHRDGPPRAIGPELTLGRHIRIVGTIEIEGDLRLQGHIEGEVHCRKLFIEPTGCIDGLAVAEVVEIDGTIIGEVFADRMKLRNNCTVEADIHHCNLVLEDGAFFEGRSRRHMSTQALIAHLDKTSRGEG